MVIFYFFFVYIDYYLDQTPTMTEQNSDGSEPQSEKKENKSPIPETVGSTDFKGTVLKTNYKIGDEVVVLSKQSNLYKKQVSVKKFSLFCRAQSIRFKLF